MIQTAITIWLVPEARGVPFVFGDDLAAGWIVRKLRLTDPDAATRERAREFIASIIGGIAAAIWKRRPPAA